MFDGLSRRESVDLLVPPPWVVAQEAFDRLRVLLRAPRRGATDTPGEAFARATGIGG